MNRVLSMIILLLLASGLIAHPASEVRLAYDKASQLLTVVFRHSVKDATQHYIEKVTITLDKKEIIVQQLDKQDNVTNGTVIFKVNKAPKGSKFSATTTCNKGGNASGSLLVE